MFFNSKPPILADPVSIAAQEMIYLIGCVLCEWTSNNAEQQSQRPVSKFHCVTLPIVSIPDYLARIRQYSTCSDACFLIAIIYLDRLQVMSPLTVDPLSIHRLFITSLMLAAKSFDDSHQRNSVYARIGGVSTAEVNALEVEFLSLINFDLLVSCDEYFQYEAALKVRGKLCVVPPPQLPPLERERVAIAAAVSTGSPRGCQSADDAKVGSVVSADSLMTRCLSPFTSPSCNSDTTRTNPSPVSSTVSSSSFSSLTPSEPIMDNDFSKAASKRSSPENLTQSPWKRSRSVPLNTDSAALKDKESPTEPRCPVRRLSTYRESSRATVTTSMDEDKYYTRSPSAQQAGVSSLASDSAAVPGLFAASPAVGPGGYRCESVSSCGIGMNASRAQGAGEYPHESPFFRAECFVKHRMAVWKRSPSCDLPHGSPARQSKNPADWRISNQ
jgi:hypothetical protein